MGEAVRSVPFPARSLPLWRLGGESSEPDSASFPAEVERESSACGSAEGPAQGWKAPLAIPTSTVRSQLLETHCHLVVLRPLIRRNQPKRSPPRPDTKGAHFRSHVVSVGVTLRSSNLNSKDRTSAEVNACVPGLSIFATAS